MRTIDSRVGLGMLAIAIAGWGCEAAPVDGGGEASGSSSEALSAKCGTRHVRAHGGVDASNDCRGAPCATIQHAIDVACDGDTVRVGHGAYRENVVVPKPVTIVGDGRHTVVRPALSAPNPCSTSALCGGAASSVFLVRASSVTIARLTVDGDDPDTQSGVVVGGADLDARNGILTDPNAGTSFDLAVDDVTVKNVFFRGVQGVGGTLTVRHSEVRNVRGDLFSIGLFEFGGAALFEENEVEDATDGIALNHSAGSVVARNRVERAGVGIHTDNAGDGPRPTADLIEDNWIGDCVTNGYGAWVFVPWVAPLVRHNRVDHCAVGLAAFGQGQAVRTSFVENWVDACGIDGSIGVRVTTDQIGYGANDVAVSLERNVVAGATVGVQIEETEGKHADAQLTCNGITHDQTSIVTQSSSVVARSNALVRGDVGVDASGVSGGGEVDARGNYWGCPGGPGSPGCETVVGNVDASSPRHFRPACVPW